jgi:hypothetical protein
MTAVIHLSLPQHFLAAQAITDIWLPPGLLDRVDASVLAAETVDNVDGLAGTDACGTGS